MRKHLTAAVALAGLCLAGPTWAANGNIGLFFDQGAALCQADAACQGGMPSVLTLYVYALLQGSSGSGITGAEYSVREGANNTLEMNENSWLFSESFDPAATTIGSGAFTPADPSPRGINMAYPSCQHGDGTKVLLETVQILNIGCTSSTLKLTVVKHSTASNQFFQCPLFTLCDAPVFTKVCLGSNLTVCRNPEPPNPNNATCSTSGQAFLNPAPGFNCTVAVQNQTWSQVKQMYNN